MHCIKKVLDKSSAPRNNFIKWQRTANYHLQENRNMITRTRAHEVQFKSLDPDEIILNEEGRYPKKIVIQNKRGEEKIYRLIKTKLGGFALNK